MPLKVEVLRSLNQWVEVNGLGPEPHVIRSNFHTSTRYVIEQDEDGAGTILTTLLPAKDGPGKELSDGIKQPVLDIEIKILEPGHPVFIEGILPGNTKSEMLRIAQE